MLKISSSCPSAIQRTTERWGSKARSRRLYTHYTQSSYITSETFDGRETAVNASKLDKPGQNQIVLQRVGETAHDGSGEISLQDLIRVVRRRRRIILTTVAVALILGILYCVVKTR